MNRFGIKKIVLLVICLINLGHCASVVHFDSDGTVVVDGQRKFIIGAYRDPSDNWRIFENLKYSGFNVAHDYYFETFIPVNYTLTDIASWIQNAQTYLTLAEESGMGVFLGLPREVILAKDNASLTQMINSVKDYNAIWFWYLKDEPTLVQTDFLDEMENLYNLVKSLDPNHPAIIVDSGDRLLEKPEFVQYCDAVWIDRYHVPYDVFEIKRDIEQIKDVFPNKILGAVAEAHDRQSYLQSTYVEDPYPERVKLNNMNTYHSVETLRAQAHGCISVNGIQSISYYWGPDYWHDMLTETTEIWQGLRQVSNELKAISKALVSPDDTHGVNVSYVRWGMNERMNQLYGHELAVSDYPRADHVNYWIRKYRGSYYIGISATYVPMQLVTIDLPFEIGRIVQYPDQKTILRKREGERALVYQDLSDVVIWDVPSNKSVSVLLNDIDSLVWRIDPYDPSVEFSYEENFLGVNNTIPEGWVVYDGTIRIYNNVYTTASGLDLTTIRSTYNSDQANQWDNYTFECSVRKDYTFLSGEAQSSSLCTGVCFRVQDDLNYYVVTVRKKTGYAMPLLIISKVVEGQFEDIAQASLEGGDYGSLWVKFVVEAYGSYLNVKLYDQNGDLIVKADAVDDEYQTGSIGTYAVVQYPYDSYYDNIIINGEFLSDIAACLQVISAYGKMQADLDGDCYVGMSDLYILMQQWLDCLDPTGVICK